MMEPRYAEILKNKIEEAKETNAIHLYWMGN
jgi:hypothetical protein